jgi:hypothetical protein
MIERSTIVREKPALLRMFNSPEDAIKWGSSNSRYHSNARGMYWNRGVATLPEFSTLLQHGDKTLENRVKGVWERYNIAPTRGIVKARIRDVAGGSPSVPAYLAGDPHCMKRRAPIIASAPVRVFASIGCSMGIEADDVEKHGVLIAALVYRLALTRPVELYATTEYDVAPFGSSENILTAIKLATRPLNLSRITTMLAHPASQRTLMFAVSDIKNNHNIGWAFGKRPFEDGNTDFYKEAWGCRKDDLFIPGVHLEDPLLRDPKGWLERTLALYEHSR